MSALSNEILRPDVQTDFLGNGPISRRADRIILVGCLLVGSQLLGPPGIIVLVVGILMLRRASTAGEQIRPLVVTVIAVFSMIDAATNLVGWSIDTFANSTHAGQVFMNGFGLLCNGAYYIDYNTSIFGGANGAGEKSWQIFCVFGLFPARIAAAWAFMKMKRWGFDLMLITSWVYAIFWFGYISNMTQNWTDFMGASEFGVIGWWVLNIWYITPFVILPWMYAVNREKWNQ